MNKRNRSVSTMHNLCVSCKTSTSGITLITLVITIIVLIILAGVSIATLTGDSGLITNASKSKFVAEVSDIKEKFELEEINNQESFKFGKLSEIIEIADEYDEMLEVENGKIVYIEEKVSENQKKWLGESAIYGKQNIIPIFTKEQLQKIASDEAILVKEVNINYNFSTTAKYELQNDIEINGNSENQWNTISNFKGEFNGNGYKISGIYVESSENIEQGMFSTNNGTIYNLKIGNFTITSTTQKRAGSIAGTNKGTIKECEIIEECFVSGMGGETGLILGKNEGDIIECAVKMPNKYEKWCDLAPVGTNTGNIDKFYNYSSLQGGNISSGVVLYNSGRIKRSVNYGKIYSYINSSAICYQNSGTIEECVNIGVITGNNNGYGGIVRKNEEKGIVKNCYNAGEVSAAGNAKNTGGIACENCGTIQNCYNIGKITISGIAHSNTGKIINSYYLENYAENLCNSNTGTIEESSSKTEEEMKLDEFINIMNTITKDVVNEETGEITKQQITQDVWEKDNEETNNGFPILKKE